jgi:hypothetical protein
MPNCTKINFPPATLRKKMPGWLLHENKLPAGRSTSGRLGALPKYIAGQQLRRNKFPAGGSTNINSGPGGPSK